MPAIVLAQVGSNSSKTKMNPAQIHASSLVIDTHADTPQFMLDMNYDLGAPSDMIHVNLDKAQRGNLAAEFFSIWVDPKYKGQFAHRTLQLIDSVYQAAAAHPDRMTMAFSPDDILAAHSQHKLAALMGIEGGHSIENDLGLLRDYYRLGVRYMTLTWTNTNDWADSSGDIKDVKVHHHDGLTDFGKDVVREMNRLGMMVDISHVSDKTFFDVISVTRAPVIASHSSARAITNAPRNMTDEMLQAISKNGGVVQVNFYSSFIDENFRKAWAAQMAEREKAEKEVEARYNAEGKFTPYSAILEVDREFAAKIPRPPLKSLIDHIDHIAKVAGIDHVGLGSDFDGVAALPEGIDSAADLPKITQALAQRGYSTDDIQKILGGNIMRVFRQVQDVSRQLNEKELATTGK